MARLKNPQHEHFCTAYVSNGFNGAKAARTARYSVKTARHQASDLLAKPDIVARIGELSENFLDGAAMELDELAAEVGRLARFNAAQLYDEDGQLMPVHEMHRDVSASVNEIEAIDGIVTKIKAGKDKRAALDMIAKNLNWYAEHQEAGRTEMNITFMAEDEEL